MPTYKASLIGGQNIVFRPYIRIDSDNVTFKIPGIFNSSEKTIDIEDIVSISISGSLLSKTIEIDSNGYGRIIATGFSRGDAKEIKRAIEYRKLNQRTKSVFQDIDKDDKFDYVNYDDFDKNEDFDDEGESNEKDEKSNSKTLNEAIQENFTQLSPDLQSKLIEEQKQKEEKEEFEKRESERKQSELLSTQKEHEKEMLKTSIKLDCKFDIPIGKLDSGLMLSEHNHGGFILFRNDFLSLTMFLKNQYLFSKEVVEKSIAIEYANINNTIVRTKGFSLALVIDILDGSALKDFPGYNEGKIIAKVKKENLELAKRISENINKMK